MIADAHDHLWDTAVGSLAASYHEVMALARTTLGGRLNPGEMDAVLGANAVTAYGLRARVLE